ncbi:MAG TPA: hypothetical protein DD738_00160 [Ruminiclostridium sp.]|nr:hypothetical protein [Ruminiclostridium sp.]
MKPNFLREVIAITVGFIVAWYAGAMFNFFPFMADDLSIRAIGFTGLLLCIVIVICTVWIIKEIRQMKDNK